MYNKPYSCGKRRVLDKNSEKVSAVDLRCNYKVEPMGIDDPEPMLSWVISDPRRGAFQNAYRIIASSTMDGLVAGKGDLWDTGK